MQSSPMGRLLSHLEWADREVLVSLERANPAPPRALDLYAHVLGAELTWLDRIEGRSTPSAPIWPDLDVAACAGLADSARGRIRALAAALSAEALSRSVHYANSAGREFDNTVEDMLLQVILHGAYHRGQIALLLRDAGAEPHPTDYISFVRGAPAATRRHSRGNS